MQNNILHVEDNADDVMLTAMAFRKAGVAVQIDVATDGDQAIAALNAADQSHRLLIDALGTRLESICQTTAAAQMAWKATAISGQVPAHDDRIVWTRDSGPVSRV